MTALSPARKAEIETLTGTPDADGDLWTQACERTFAIRDLLAELRRREWQPIETAPKDGRVVDLWCVGEASDIDFYCPVHRRHTNRTQREGRVVDVAWRDEAWRRPVSSLRLYPLSVTPTHWQPLPPGATER